VAVNIWDVLNNNAPAVQALAAVVTTVATVVLVIVTRRYVKLTSDLAQTAQEQIKLLQAEATARRRELMSLIRRLRLALSHLPSSASNAETMRDVAVWSEAEMLQLQKLASELGQTPGQWAATTADALRWLQEKIEGVKSTNPRIGVKWEQFPWEAWTGKLQAAQERLEKLWQTASGTEAR
jgi:hypothetical protein